MAKPKNIDEYLKNLEGHFAHPVLARVRELIHHTVPGIEEKIKWGAPSFEYKGLMMSMVAFKEHSAVWFHKGALFNDPQNLLEASSENTKAMRKYQISANEDLNEEGLKGLILEAVAANDKGEQVEGYNQRDKTYDQSDLLDEALKSNRQARDTYNGFSDYKKREYVEFIETAKQEATRQRRLKKSLDLLEQGLGLNDKYRK
ncbi:MAG: DUF1801 domain-containing protein [Owenweeksia sp.]